MSATTFLALAVAVALAAVVAAVVWVTREEARSAAGADEALAVPTNRRPGGPGERPGRVAVVAAYRSLVHQARGVSTRRLVRIERRLRTAYQLGRLDADAGDLVRLAAVRSVLVERGVATEPVPSPFLADVLAAIGAEEWVWCERICERLAAAYPQRYDGWWPPELAVALRHYGVSTEMVRGRRDDGTRVVLRGVRRRHVVDALTRPGLSEGTDRSRR